jgi:hypothetical protein
VHGVADADPQVIAFGAPARLAAADQRAGDLVGEPALVFVGQPDDGWARLEPRVG